MSKLFPCIERQLYRITHNCDISWFKILNVIIGALLTLVKIPYAVIYFKLNSLKLFRFCFETSFAVTSIMDPSLLFVMF
jgi:hypothetical protein